MRDCLSLDKRRSHEPVIIGSNGVCQEDLLFAKMLFFEIHIWYTECSEHLRTNELLINSLIFCYNLHHTEFGPKSFKLVKKPLSIPNRYPNKKYENFWTIWQPPDMKQNGESEGLIIYKSRMGAFLLLHFSATILPSYSYLYQQANTLLVSVIQKPK